MNGIQIQIIGAAGSGKTSIAQVIVDILREKGLAVKWDVTPDYTSESKARFNDDIKLKVLEAVSNKSTIIVKEIQAPKDFNAALNYRIQNYTKTGE